MTSGFSFVAKLSTAQISSLLVFLYAAVVKLTLPRCEKSLFMLSWTPPTSKVTRGGAISTTLTTWSYKWRNDEEKAK